MNVQPTKVRLLNLLLFGILLSVGFFTFLSWINVRSATIPEAAPKQKFTLPHSFKQPQEAQKAVGEPFMALQKNEIKLALPDLRAILMYFGSTVRPDVSESAQIVQMGVRGSTTPSPVSVGSPIYLKYDPKGNANKWSFSPDNKATPIWIEIKPQEGTCEVQLYMNDSEGNKIREPHDFASFMLTQVHLPYAPQGANGFEVAGQRADASLLIRQKCVWFGQDLFLQELGDDTTQFAFNKERLDFLDPENSYFCFVGQGDCLAFSDNRWHQVQPGPESRNKPLLVAKKVDDKSIAFDLWDPKGKVRIPLELRKAAPMPNFAAKFDFKLVGARSRRDWIAEFGGVRMLVRADDWLILQTDGWKKIATAEELDDYITGKLRGPLLVLEGTEKAGNDVGLIGRVYDFTRTQVVPLRISLFKSWEQAAPAESKESEDEDDDDDEEDDDDDDEEDDDDDDEDEDLV